jgi:hypothetical protein
MLRKRQMPGGIRTQRPEIGEAFELSHNSITETLDNLVKIARQKEPDGGGQRLSTVSATHRDEPELPLRILTVCGYGCRVESQR